MTHKKIWVMVATNLIRDLLAVTTACESCTILPFDEILSFVLKLPVPRATTSYPLARERQKCEEG